MSISQGPRQADPAFDPQPGGWLLAGDDEGDPLAARVTRRADNRVWVAARRSCARPRLISPRERVNQAAAGHPELQAGIGNFWPAHYTGTRRPGWMWPAVAHSPVLAVQGLVAGVGRTGWDGTGRKRMALFGWAGRVITIAIGTVHPEHLT